MFLDHKSIKIHAIPQYQHNITLLGINTAS